MSTNDGLVCPTFEVKHAHASDMGMRRANNQDALAVMVTDDIATWAARGHIMMVADGMGAHAAGELASKLAVDNIPHTYLKLRDLYPPAALRQAIRDANAVIHSKGQSSIGFQGMGTTCSCLVLLPQGALVAHIGDSRVYRLRGQTLEQLTFDHSLVWEMAAAGQMTEDDVPSYIPKNVITRSLGPHASVHIDLEGPYGAAAGDAFLICSDGLSGPIADEEMGAILQCMDPDEAAQTFVDLANLRGGPDNISLVIVKIGDKSPHVSQVTSSSQPSGESFPVAPLWIAAGAFLAGVVYCAANQQWIGVIGSAIGLAVALMLAIRSRPAQAIACPQIGSIGGPYGNGPYRKWQCAPNAKVVAAFADLATKLRELSTKEPAERSVDWARFEAARTEAAVAAEKSDYAAAIRQYSQAICTVMRQLRDRPTVDSDSGQFHRVV